MRKIGIRHEDKYLLERRVSLSPIHVEKLIKENGLEVHVQRSAKRVFTDDEFLAVGAHLVDGFPDDVSILFGVKEMSIESLRMHDTHVLFSHTIKGQEYNMPMLQRMMDLQINLIDYERISDGQKRLIFFGRFAGLAGAINSLWSLGKRLELKGIQTPFNKLKQAHTYSSLEAALKIIREIAAEIAANGLPEAISPLVIGITGYGNVGQGTFEVIDLLPVVEFSPSQLLSTDLTKLSNKKIVKIVFKEEDLSKRIDGLPFELNHYYAHPEEYINRFEDYMPKISILLNCMYWNNEFPRIVTKDFAKTYFESGNSKLVVIGDISCDPNGSIEFTHSGTTIGEPVYVYNPILQRFKIGFEGIGFLVMAVDILPSELPRESSISFGDALLPFVVEIATADFSQKFDDLKLSPEIKRALILHNGELTPEYQYLKEYLISINQ